MLLHLDRFHQAHLAVQIQAAEAAAALAERANLCGRAPHKRLINNFWFFGILFGKRFTTAEIAEAAEKVHKNSARSARWAVKIGTTPLTTKKFTKGALWVPQR
jgi:hypothetical protein